MSVGDRELLERYVPYLRYDSLESFRADSAAVLPEQFYAPASGWGYTNALKRRSGAAPSSRGGGSLVR